MSVRKSSTPAQVFPPGEYLREELAAHGWTQAALARIIGRPLQTVNHIRSARKWVTVETAKELDLALENASACMIATSSRRY
jgi:HTH-type transcriptional regulator/antitoxin HigA